MKQALYRAFFPFGGIGAGARGFLDARVSLLETDAAFECVGGIDNDREACADFKMLTGVAQRCADVSSMTPAELRALAGDDAPDVVFLSPPCLPGHGLVLTAKGTRAIESIRAGDEVFTHRGRYRRVTMVGSHRYSGLMFGVRLHGTVDVQEFTAEHPLWVRRMRRTKATARRRELGTPSFIPAAGLRVGDRIGFEIGDRRSIERCCVRRRSSGGR